MSASNFRDCLPLRGRWLAYLLNGLAVGLWLTAAVELIRPRYHVTPVKGPVGAAKTQIGSFKTALELYRVDHGGEVPTTQKGLLALIRPPTHGSDPCWKGPYLNDVTDLPLDPWHHTYVYASPGPRGAPYLIMSYGADGRPGGVEQASDLTNIRRQSQ